MHSAVRRAAALMALCLSTACDSGAPEAPPPARFASVQKPASDQAAASFCEKQWPAAPAVEARPYRELPERPLPGGRASAAAPAGAWKWVNLWATWCLPCVEEMRLLARWQRTLEQDGIRLDLQTWSVDEDEATLADYLKSHPVPGRVRWVRSPADLPAVLAALGAAPDSGVPVHALIDGAGNLRCLRVGAVHDEDYGAVKSLLAGG